MPVYPPVMMWTCRIKVSVGWRGGVASARVPECGWGVGSANLAGLVGEVLFCEDGFRQEEGLTPDGAHDVYKAMDESNRG